jgi:hypothetical protein
MARSNARLALRPFPADARRDDDREELAELADGATTFALPDLRPRNVGLPAGMSHVISTGE